MIFDRGARLLPDGRVRVRLGSAEHQALSELPGQLGPLLRGDTRLDTPAGSLTERLFPRAYEDPLAEIEYHEMVGAGLVEERLAALETFAATLRRGHAGARTWTIELSGEEADSWLSALNDARLTLAMVAGVVTEADWEETRHRGDSASVLLGYLGWLQEELLTVLLERLD